MKAVIREHFRTEQERVVTQYLAGIASNRLNERFVADQAAQTPLGQRWAARSSV